MSQDNLYGAYHRTESENVAPTNAERAQDAAKQTPEALHKRLAAMEKMLDKFTIIGPGVSGSLKHGFAINSTDESGLGASNAGQNLSTLSLQVCQDGEVKTVVFYVADTGGAVDE